MTGAITAEEAQPTGAAARVVITSFGYRHAAPPPAEVTLDVRRVLRDPHTDPQLRDLTGLDDVIRAKVARTPGALGLVTSTTNQVASLLEEVSASVRIDVSVGCAGGRHRSVVLAEVLAGLLRGAGFEVRVEHRDLHQPVLPLA